VSALHNSNVFIVPAVTRCDGPILFTNMVNTREKIAKAQAKREANQLALEKRPKLRSFASLVRSRDQGGVLPVRKVIDVDEEVEADVEVEADEEEVDEEVQMGDEGVEEAGEEVEMNDEGLKGAGSSSEAGDDTNVSDEDAGASGEDAEASEHVEAANARKNVEVTASNGAILVRVREYVSRFFFFSQMFLILFSNSI
jgi:hypothetical protein